MMMIVAQIGNNKLTYSCLIMSMTVFHFGTLEEYYLGILELPPCNGVSDGSVFVISFYIVAGIIGNRKFAINVHDGKWMRVEGID